MLPRAIASWIAVFRLALYARPFRLESIKKKALPDAYQHLRISLLVSTNNKFLGEAVARGPWCLLRRLNLPVAGNLP